MTSKLSRVLSVYHLFRNCREVSFEELRQQLGVSEKTSLRDIRLLERAGVLEVRYGRKYRAFYPVSLELRPMAAEENQTRRKYLEKVRRLCVLMARRAEEAEWSDLSRAELYRGLFPEQSDRTRQRAGPGKGQRHRPACRRERRAGKAVPAGPCPVLLIGGNEMIYAMSDIHGCYDKYRTMLSEIAFKSTDTLYVLGDVIDRGPDGIQLLRDMSLRPNVFPILGNHEFTAAVCIPWLLKEVTRTSLADLDETQLAALNEWLTNGGGPTLKAFQQLTQEERQDILEYLQEMELYAEVEAGGRSFVLTHAAPNHFAPEKPLDAYELQDLLFGRPELDTIYYPDKILVLGHTPTRFLGGQDKILKRGTWIDIDCGCVAQNGRLGCLCLDTMEEFYV